MQEAMRASIRGGTSGWSCNVAFTQSNACSRVIGRGASSLSDRVRKGHAGGKRPCMLPCNHFSGKGVMCGCNASPTRLPALCAKVCHLSAEWAGGLWKEGS